MASSIVRTDGFYSSGPVKSEDWHAGVHMQETQYHFWRFYLDGNWVCCHRYDPSSAFFWHYTQRLTTGEIEAAQRVGTSLTEGGLELFVAGTFVEAEEMVTTVREFRFPVHPTGEMTIRNEMKWRPAADGLESIALASAIRLAFVSVDGYG